ncbi:MAG: SAM-dependent methyltransferase [Chitinophagaceae bacterium]
MKADKASKTAQLMALNRALETKHPADKRLFSDPYAIHFLEGSYRFAAMVSVLPFARKLVHNIGHKRIPGAFSSGIARTKYIDDLLQHTIEQGVQQVMILGAGFDTRGLRLQALQSIPVIEIDHPNTSRRKTSILKKQLKQLPANIVYCEIDFNKQSLDQLAATYNFNFSIPTTIIWEGVTNYLTAEAINKTFAFISRFAKGSYAIFTYVHLDVLKNPASFYGAEKLLQDLASIEESWTFGFDPAELADYLKDFHLTLLSDSGANEYRNMYMPERTEKGYEFYRVAVARVSTK